MKLVVKKFSIEYEVGDKVTIVRSQTNMILFGDMYDKVHTVTGMRQEGNRKAVKFEGIKSWVDISYVEPQEVFHILTKGDLEEVFNAGVAYNSPPTFGSDDDPDFEQWYKNADIFRTKD